MFSAVKTCEIITLLDSGKHPKTMPYKERQRCNEQRINSDKCAVKWSAGQ